MIDEPPCGEVIEAIVFFFVCHIPGFFIIGSKQVMFCYGGFIEREEAMCRDMRGNLILDCKYGMFVKDGVERNISLVIFSLLVFLMEWLFKVGQWNGRAQAFDSTSWEKFPFGVAMN
eukprot:559834-Ditylum_brightwellii.AAC.1